MNCMHMKTYNILNDSEPVLAPSDIHSLNTTLSKTSKKILIALYHSEELPHKSLAADLHTSPTSLSNIIARMRSVVPSLLESKKSGRTVFYSLSPIARLYVEQELAPNGAAASFKVLSRGNLKNMALERLYQFQDITGKEWDVKLDDMLSDSIQKENFGNRLYNNIYRDFTDYMTQLKLQNDYDSITLVYSALENPILIKRMKNFLSKRLEAYDDLLPIFELEKKDISRTCMLIDYIFTQITNNIFKSFDIMRHSTDFPITKEQYSLIGARINTMINELFQYEGNTQKAINDWTNRYFVINASVHYIIEKCNTVYLVESSRSSR